MVSKKQGEFGGIKTALTKIAHIWYITSNVHYIIADKSYWNYLNIQSNILNIGLLKQTAIQLYYVTTTYSIFLIEGDK